MNADKRVAKLERQLALSRQEHDKAMAGLRKVSEVVHAIESGEHATSGRDYGRGMSNAVKLIRLVMEQDVSVRVVDLRNRRWPAFAIVGWLITLIGAGAYAAARVPNPDTIDQIIRYGGTSLILGGLWLVFEAGRRYGRQNG